MNRENLNRETAKDNCADNKYADIINLPHPVSSRHPQMPLKNRAAQFMPFAALTGYGDAIDETARVTEEKLDLTEDELRLLDEKLAKLRPLLSQRPEVTFTYFEPDARKEGGAYITRTGIVKKIDEYGRSILLEDGTVIPMDALKEIVN